METWCSHFLFLFWHSVNFIALTFTITKALNRNFREQQPPRRHQWFSSIAISTGLSFPQVNTLNFTKKILQPLPYGASPFLECQYPKNLLCWLFLTFLQTLTLHSQVLPPIVIDTMTSSISHTVASALASSTALDHVPWRLCGIHCAVQKGG